MRATNFFLEFADVYLNHVQFNSQSSSGIGLGIQAPGFNTGSAGHLQQPGSIQQQFSEQALTSAAPKDSGILLFKC